MPLQSILIVCQGNICRSPMAEGFFAQQLSVSKPSAQVISAGLNAMVNFPADTHAQQAMQTIGIDISQHRAQQLTEKHVRESHLILVMTHRQLKELLDKHLRARGKSFLIGHWQNYEITDPYQQSHLAFEKVREQIMLGWEDWKSRII